MRNLLRPLRIIIISWFFFSTRFCLKIEIKVMCHTLIPENSVCAWWQHTTNRYRYIQCFLCMFFFLLKKEVRLSIWYWKKKDSANFWLESRIRKKKGFTWTGLHKPQIKKINSQFNFLSTKLYISSNFKCQFSFSWHLNSINVYATQSRFYKWEMHPFCWFNKKKKLPLPQSTAIM